LAEVERKEEGTMSSREDQAQKESTVNGAAEGAESRIFALDPGEGEAWWWMGGLATVKATAEQTGGRYTLVEILVPEFPMEESLLHVHHFEDEGFYVLEGEMTFYVGDETIKASPGSFLFGPKDVPYRPRRRSRPTRPRWVGSWP
jgi:mannose-6-phosphate isomerase-like protein (cupin superfamily)